MRSSLVIGVCAAFERARWSFWDMPAAIVASTYLSHLAHDGATPVALIPSEATIGSAERLIGTVDGLLLVGGADVDPDMYGEQPDALLEATVPLRDRSEIALVRAALAQGVPVFGVCRGLHVMNVATGGTLVQDLGELGDSRHRKAPGRLDEPTFHKVDVAANSSVAEALGTGSAMVNSHHHQAVKRIGAGGTATAISPEDGVIEAVEWTEHGFALGVQWHPEAAELDGLFRVFLDECRARASREGNQSDHQEQAREKEPENGNA